MYYILAEISDSRGAFVRSVSISEFMTVMATKGRPEALAANLTCSKNRIDIVRPRICVLGDAHWLHKDEYIPKTLTVFGVNKYIYVF